MISQKVVWFLAGICLMGCSAVQSKVSDKTLSMKLDELCRRLFELKWPPRKSDLDALIDVRYGPNVGNFQETYRSEPFVTDDGFVVENVELRGNASHSEGEILAALINLSRTPCYKLEHIKGIFDAKPYLQPSSPHIRAKDEPYVGLRYEVNNIEVEFLASEASKNCVVQIAVFRTDVVKSIK